MRKDKKRSNSKKSTATVSIVKCLYQQGIPVRILSTLFDVADSTVVMWGMNHRQASVEPAQQNTAITELYKRFKKLVGDLPPDQSMKPVA